MFIAIPGRQPEISLAELRAVYGEAQVDVADSVVLVDSQKMDINRLGGTIKYGEVIHELHIKGRTADDFQSIMDYITRYYHQIWKSSANKITLGISVYGLPIDRRDVQKIGLRIKSLLKKDGVSLRLIPNDRPALSTATSHNNKLGLSDNKIELIIAKKSDNQVVIAESRGSQNITAYTKRDHEKPYRDAFVGMLPPKLAQIMINLAIGSNSGQIIEKGTILDPFCGTGTVLQEALLMGFDIYGTDLNPKMVDYSTRNLAWLTNKFPRLSDNKVDLNIADAMDYHWANSHQISAIVSEVYLGQPFSAPPSPEKLKQVIRNCDHIASSFLRNIKPQLAKATPLCLALPAWQQKNGTFAYLPLVQKLSSLGYRQTVSQPLLYHREGQVVARQLLVIKSI